MVPDLSIWIEAEPGRPGVDELNPFDLEAHAPFNKGCFTVHHHRFRFQEHVITALHQTVLGKDVGVNALPFLGWIGEMHVTGIDGFPLRSCGARRAVGLGEQGTDLFCVQRRVKHGCCHQKSAPT